MNTLKHTKEQNLTQPQPRKTWLKTTDNADLTDKKQEVSPIGAIREIRGLLFCTLLLGALATAQADTLTVTTLDDSGPGSLRQAIADAAPGDTIDFATNVTGTITLTSGELVVTNNLIISGPGPTNLTISGNNASRVFAFTNVTAMMSALAVADGNVGPYGAGGGIVSFSSRLVLNKCAVTRNSANDGSGIFMNLGNLTIIQSVISSNVSSVEEYAEGGGINNIDGMLDVRDSAIVGNSAYDGGGGIYSSGGSSELRLTNCTVSGNSVYLPDWGAGGGMKLSSTTSIIVNSTICSNKSNKDGGGIWVSGRWPYLRNSIVAGNHAATHPDYSGYFHSLGYNLIQNTNDVGIDGDTAHNLYNQDPKLGPLADLGGPTPTHALRFDSPAIDAGHSGGLTTDQRGLPRPVDDPNTPNAEGGDGSDIGAYEADPNLRITIEKAGADIRLRFNTLFGKMYAVESEDNLDGSWGTLTNNIPGTGGAIQAQDLGAANLSRRFYRAFPLP